MDKASISRTTLAFPRLFGLVMLTVLCAGALTKVRRVAVSGIRINPEVVDAVASMVRKDKYQWIVCRVNDISSEVVLESTEVVDTTAKKSQYSMTKDQLRSSMKSLWWKVISSLPDSSPRFVVFNHLLKSYGIRQATYLLLWIPEKGHGRENMIFVSTMSAFEKAIVYYRHKLILESKSKTDFENMFQDIL